MVGDTTEVGVDVVDEVEETDEVGDKGKSKFREGRAVASAMANARTDDNGGVRGKDVTVCTDKTVAS